MVFSGSRKWVYAQGIKGRFERIHRFLGYFQLAFLIALPLIPVRGRPLLQVDLPARRLYAFGSTYTPADTVFLLILLLIGAFGLFFFTSLYGRLWCGFACPQTVFLEQLVRPFERWVEGDRNRRMMRDSSARGSFDWAWRKGVKIAGFAAISLVVSAAFMALFAGPDLWVGGGGPAENALVGAFGFLLFVDFAWFREQFCTYVCPYARFQSVMCDDESLVVSYSEVRGEPRGKERKVDGGCIDCNKCVVVCPAGIDIRDGFQLECISCGRCIDACATVLPKLGHENLIRYATIAETEGRKVRAIRPRTVVYGGLLALLAAALVFTLSNRHLVEATVNRVPGPAYTIDADGWVRNTYMLQVANNDTRGAETVTVAIEGLPGAEMVVPALSLEPTERRSVPLVVRIPAADASGRSLPMTVRVGTGHDEILLQTTFMTGAHVGAPREGT